MANDDSNDQKWYEPQGYVIDAIESYLDRRPEITDTGDAIDELGGLSEAERAQLGDDLRREMEKPGVWEIDPRQPQQLDPDCVDTTPDPNFSDGIMADGSRVGERPADATSGADPCDTHDHQAAVPPSALDKLRDAVRSFKAGETDAVDAQFGARRRTTNLRQQIEEAVEGLSFAITGGYSDAAGSPPPTKNVVEVDRLLDEFDRIFGSRPTAQIVDLMEALRASLQMGPRPPMPEPEHESAADRRERTSALNERSDGHVEGVDR